MNLNNFHGDRFELCRICLTEPARHVKYINIFRQPQRDDFVIQDQMLELLGIHIDPNDIKPKIICENCYKSLLAWYEMKRKAGEADIVINYIATKKFNYAIPGPSEVLAIPGTSGTSAICGTSGTSAICGTSNSSRMLKNNDESTQESFNVSRTIIKRSRTIVTNLNGCSSSSSCEQGTSRGSLVPSSSELVSSGSESDCIEVTPPIETVILISDDEDNASIANECINLDSSDNDDIIELSDSEDDTINLKIENVNEETEKMYYCSICQMKNILNHDCSLFSKSFFTCLVPNCNILSRSLQDFTPHYQLHIGMPSSAVICLRCYQEADGSNLDINGCHIKCLAVNGFKCYTCNVIFNNMQAFSFHKLKTHNGRLMDCFGNYLCLHCEESSPDLMNIINHTKHCLKNQEQNVTANTKKPEKPSGSRTRLSPAKKKTENAMVRKNKKKKSRQTSKLSLFTCLKPNCNLVFQTLSVFKFHYREHFGLGNKLVCWQCCEPFSDLSSLRAHQVKNNCRNVHMFQCYKCMNKFDNLESLSFHKLSFHAAKLIVSKTHNKNKTFICEFCKLSININSLETHLVTCQKQKVKKSEPTATCTKYEGTYACETCSKVFHSTISLSNHRRIHYPSRLSTILKNEADH